MAMGHETVKTMAPDGLTTEIVSVTPEIAKTWLATNARNRVVRKGMVRRYARDMAEGRWCLTHQGIAFDRDGNLIDGQHRLKAVVLSGATIKMAVVRGCDPESFVVLDSGGVRTSGDRLGLAGVSSAKQVGAIARNALLFGFKEPSVTPARVHEWALQNLAVLRDFVPLAKRYTAACAAGFVYAKMIDLDGVDEAVERMVAYEFGPSDPMKQLALKLAARKGGIGNGAQRSRFDLAMTALRTNAKDVREARLLTRRGGLS